MVWVVVGMAMLKGRRMEVVDGAYLEDNKALSIFTPSDD